MLQLESLQTVPHCFKLHKLRTELHLLDLHGAVDCFLRTDQGLPGNIINN